MFMQNVTASVFKHLTAPPFNRLRCLAIVGIVFSFINTVKFIDASLIQCFVDGKQWYHIWLFSVSEVASYFMERNICGCNEAYRLKLIRLLLYHLYVYKSIYSEKSVLFEKNWQI